jgi:hypothetical protein
MGFATPIPALSLVTVQVSRKDVTPPANYSGGNYFTGIPYFDYVDYATLTAVTIGATTYPIQTDSIPLLKGSSNSDVVFTLTAPLKLSQ